MFLGPAGELVVTEALHNLSGLQKLLHSTDNTDLDQIRVDMDYEMAEKGKQRIKNMISGRFKNLQNIINVENKEHGFLKSTENLVSLHFERFWISHDRLDLAFVLLSSLVLVHPCSYFFCAGSCFQEQHLLY